MVESHPHEAWQKRNFGVYHTSNGRWLPQHLADLAGPISHPEQEDRLRHWLEVDPQRRKTNAPFEPGGDLVRGAREYNRRAGLGDPHGHSYAGVTTTPEAIRRIGRAYGELPYHDRDAEPHFHAMHDEVGRQFDHLTRPESKGGMGIHVESVDHDPYANVHEMVHDLKQNKRLKVLGTHVTGSHPFFDDTANDRFRSVHDAFGHAATGRGFDAHGEEAAYQAHSKMFTPHAHPALQTETQSQNAFLHLNGDFGPQKIAVVSPHILHPDSREVRRYGSAEKALGTPEEIARFESGRQRVQDVGGKPKCDFHREMQLGQEALSGDVSRQTGLGLGLGSDVDPRPYEGRCVDCTRSQKGRPWERNKPRRDQVELTERMPGRPQERSRRRLYPSPGNWPYNSEAETREFTPEAPSHMSARYAVRVGQKSLAKDASSLKKLAYRLSGDMPNVIKIGHQDSSQTIIFHCPACGSGSVIARTDGSVECGFCGMCFVVQVQPQYPAFPQTINGEPVDVPGMGPDFSDYTGNAVDPEEVPDEGEDDDEGDEGDAEPMGPNASETDPSEDEEEDQEPLKTAALRTSEGREVDKEALLQHMALKHTSNAKRTLQRIRRTNGV
jgi:hypothetical protein